MPMKLTIARVLVAAAFLASSHQAFAGIIKVVDWNIEADVNNVTTPRAGFNTVLKGIGQEKIAGAAQPLDILALEETTSDTTTVAPIVSMLNADYAGANFKMSTYQATESGGSPTTGNGPSALVYNANTLTLVASVGVGTPTGSANGEYRQVVRYEFTPVGGANPFYVYVSHMKSGTTTADAADRAKEAAIIRANEATLPANSSVIYTGDLNASSGAMFTTFTAAGPGAASDPAAFSTARQYMTDSSTAMRFRDDYQLITSNVMNGTGAIAYVNGSLETFGNNGTTASGASTSSSANTALNYMTTANGYALTQSQILSALTTASDHLPNIAEYSFVAAPEPASLTLLAAAALPTLARRRRR